MFSVWILGLGFGRVVHDPFSAGGRFGPAFMPGAMCGRLTPAFFSLVLGFCRVVHDPFSAEGRIGPAFTPGTWRTLDPRSILVLVFGRVVHDPFSAEGRIGPAFTPGYVRTIEPQILVLVLGFWQGRSRPFLGRRPHRPGVHAGYESDATSDSDPWVLVFGRVVHDPFSAEGRIGPAFTPGTWRSLDLEFWS